MLYSKEYFKISNLILSIMFWNKIIGFIADMLKRF